MADRSNSLAVRFMRWLLWHTARFDNRETWLWNRGRSLLVALQSDEKEPTDG